MLERVMMLSAFVIARDAEWLLPHVCANLRRFCAEIVLVIDDASVDDSFEVARRLADVAVCWPVGYGVPEAVRNEAAALCRGDWLLMVDDDELFPPAWSARLPELLAWGPQEFGFPRRHVIGDGSRWITSAPWWPDWQIRLRSRAAWEHVPWPRHLHAVPPDYCRQMVMAPFWHLKFMVKSRERREARMALWGASWGECLNDHYRRFSVPEGYDWQMGPVDEEPPVELAEMIAAGVVDHGPA
jgi:hypothetical protein